MRVLLIAHSGRGARARTDTVRSRAASGIMSTGITAGARGAAAGLGQERAGNARELPRPRKPGLKSKSRGLETLARAAVERREASASRWTRIRAGSAFGVATSECVVRIHGTVAPIGAPPPFYFLEAELGTGLVKLGRGCVARTRPLAPS